MDNILFLLAVFVFLRELLEISLIPSRLCRYSFALLTGAAIVLEHSYALGGNKLVFEEMMSAKDAALNLSLVVMGDVVFTFFFASAVAYPGRRIRKKILGYFPSLLIFPTLYYLHMNLFFASGGLDFGLITGLFAGGTFLLFLLFPRIYRLLFPDKESGLELIFLLSLFIAALSLCTTIFHPSTTIYTRVGEAFDWRSLAGVAAGIAILGVTGYLWTRYGKQFMYHIKFKR